MMGKSAEKNNKGADINWIHSRFFTMNALINGLVGAVLGGCGLALATLWLVIKGGRDVGAHLRLLNNFLPGYTVTYWGSLIGFGYGVLIGFTLCYTASKLYNFFLDRRRKAKESR